MSKANYSWRLKLDRAQARLDEFISISNEDKIQDLRVEEVPTDAGDLDSHIYPTEEPDVDLASAILGEAFYSVRAGLDHLMGALVPPSRREHTQFPVFLEEPARDPKRYSQWMQLVTGVSAAALTVLDQVQPYHWAADASAPLPHVHPLARTHSWNIIDKHRAPLVTLGSIQVDEDISFEPYRGIRIPPEPTGGPLDLGLRIGGVYRTFALHLEQQLRGRLLLVIEDPLQPPPGTVDPGVRRAFPAAASVQHVIDYVRDEVYTPLEPHLHR